MAVQEGIHARIEVEAHKDLATPTEHHNKGHQRARGSTDWHVPKMSPVDLGLVTGQGAKTQVRLG